MEGGEEGGHLEGGASTKVEVDERQRQSFVKDTAEEGETDASSDADKLLGHDEMLEQCWSQGPQASTQADDQPASDGHQIEFEVEEGVEAGAVSYVPYKSEVQMPDIMRLMRTDLSEPYSIYTYRYFIHNWPRLCILAKCDDHFVGAIVCKLEVRHYGIRRGYIAMLAVDKDYRKRKIGSTLVKRSIRQMVIDGCDEVVLETEVTNRAALSLYENLGFVRDKYLHQYYLNGVDAYRLKLWLKDALA